MKCGACESPGLAGRDGKTMDERTHSLLRKLKSRLPLFGAARRARAARELAGTSVPEAVGPLVEARSDRSEKVRLAVRDALAHLQGEARDRLCGLRAESRDPGLESVLLEGRYAASGPASLRCLTFLKQGMGAAYAGGGAGEVDLLLECLGDRDEGIREGAREVLAGLTNVEGIDRLCGLWAESRSDLLKWLLVEGGYVASDPPLLRARTIFLQRRQPETTFPREVIDACLEDPDVKVATWTAFHVLKVEGRERGKDRLWSFCMSHPETVVLKALEKWKLRPRDSRHRALFFFLLDDMESYYASDMDRSHLRYWYGTSEGALKEAIAARIRKSGDRGLTSVFRAGRDEALDEREVALQMEILEEIGDHEGLFHLLPRASTEQGKCIVNALKTEDWTRFGLGSYGDELGERLKTAVDGATWEGASPLPCGMALYQDFRPMLLKGQTPPETEPQLLEWLRDRDDFRRRSAALLSLAERSSPCLADAANGACSDEHWQVRLAASLAELLRPGSLSPANRNRLLNDHVQWVGAVLNLPKEDRLVEYGPEDLEWLAMSENAFSSSRKPSKPDGFYPVIEGFLPEARRAYLLALAEFFRMDVVVEEINAA